MDKKLVNFNMYWIAKNSECDNESDKNVWTGQILVNPEDTSFDGLVFDRSEGDYRLISGTLVDYNGMSSIMFNNKGQLPFAFYGFSDGNQIIGSIDEMLFLGSLFFNTIRMGNFRTIMEFANQDEQAIRKLEDRVSVFKDGMDGFNSSLYKSMYSQMRETFDGFMTNLNQDRSQIESTLDIKTKKLGTIMDKM